LGLWGAPQAEGRQLPPAELDPQLLRMLSTLGVHLCHDPALLARVLRLLRYAVQRHAPSLAEGRPTEEQAAAHAAMQQVRQRRPERPLFGVQNSTVGAYLAAMA
jgi:hypothetical protein